MRFIVAFVFLFFPLFLTSSVQAEDFTNDYKAEYFLNTPTDSQISSHVKFTLTLTNSRSDVYVKKVTLAFPKTFIIRNVQSADGKTIVQPDAATDATKTTIHLEFADPAIGKDSKNVAVLEFDQDNLFKVNGNVWEVILPTIEDKAKKNYEILVHLPADTQKKISIAKPVPDEIHGNTIQWKNVDARTIYAVFGDTQYYKTLLNYHLKNPKIVPVYTDVAFPPDSSFQKIFVDAIDPAPNLTYTDEDGNFMGRYYLKPKEQLDVLFSGTVGLFTLPRADMIPIISTAITSQKQYLLTEKSYWKLGPVVGIENVKTAQDIYNYLVKNFKYNYQRVSKEASRMGAQEALLHPDQPVCVEFSDTFVAMAREKGIYSREIEGYGFSNDPQLRPLSRASDILHSWPEYYDPERGAWIPVDPTWGNTSGIDYFSSFDLNHITFAIHGKRPDYPLPAGSYKIEDSHDIAIRASQTTPDEKLNVQLLSPKFPEKITDRGIYTSKVILKNNSNTFVYNVPVSVTSDTITITPSSQIITSLAPFEQKEIPLELKSTVANKKTDAHIQIHVLKENVYNGVIVILPYYYEFGLKVGYGVLIVSSGILLVYFIWKLRSGHR